MPNEEAWDKFRELALRWLPASLLLVAAASHFALAETAYLTAWKGAGFGMFATTDGGSSRHFHVYALTDRGDVELRIPRELFDMISRVRELPTERQMRAFGKAMLPFAPDGACAIRVELWKTIYDPETMWPESKVLRVIEINSDEL